MKGGGHLLKRLSTGKRYPAGLVAPRVSPGIDCGVGYNQQLATLRLKFARLQAAK